MDKLLTPDDVAAILQVSRRTAYTYMGQMIHLAGPLRVSESSLREWMLERAQPGRMNPRRPMGRAKRKPIRGPSKWP